MGASIPSPFVLPVEVVAQSAGQSLAVPGMSRYVQKDEKVLLTISNLVVGLTIRVNVRTVTSGNERIYKVIPFSYAPPSDGSIQTQEIPVQECVIESAYICVTAGTPGNTDTYVELGIARRSSGSSFARSDQFALLLAGYITASQSISTAPRNSQLGSSSNIFQLISVSGSPHTLTVPAGQVYIIHGAHIKFTTDATVANRTFYQDIRSPSGAASNAIYWQQISAVLQAASLIYEYVLGGYEESGVVISAGGTNIVKLKQSPIQMLPLTGLLTSFINKAGGDAMGGNYYAEIINL